MSVLVDTNVLLRRAQSKHHSNGIAIESVARLLDKGEPVYVTLQNIAEFWNAATRPAANNGLGLSLDFVLREVENMEAELEILGDVPAMYEEWKRLVIKHKVIGVKVHDAKLVAAMNVHGIKKILTFNADDFARYEVEVLHPAEVAL